MGIEPRRIVKSWGASSPARAKWPLRRLGAALLPEPLRQAELGTRLLVALGGHGHEPRAPARPSAAASPRTHARTAARYRRRVHAGDVAERVGAERHVVRARDAARLVDPDRWSAR